MDIVIAIVAAVVGIALGAFVGYYYANQRTKRTVESAEVQAQRIRANAETDAKAATVQARDEALRLRNEADRDIKRGICAEKRTGCRNSERPSMSVSRAWTSGSAT
jgi:ribonuclease Y